MLLELLRKIAIAPLGESFVSLELDQALLLIIITCSNKPYISEIAISIALVQKRTIVVSKK